MQPVLMQNSAGESTQWIAIAVGILGLAYLLLRPRLGRRRDPLENAGPRLSLAQQRSLERDMNNLVVELSEMARQITAQLDTRSAKLEALIREADQRLEELRRMTAAVQAHEPHETAGPSDSAAPASSAALPSAVSPSAVSPSAGLDARHAEVYALADEGLSAHAIAQRLQRPTGEVELILALRTTPAKN